MQIIIIIAISNQTLRFLQSITIYDKQSPLSVAKYTICDKQWGSMKIENGTGYSTPVPFRGNPRAVMCPSPLYHGLEYRNSLARWILASIARFENGGVFYSPPFNVSA